MGRSTDSGGAWSTASIGVFLHQTKACGDSSAIRGGIPTALSSMDAVICNMPAKLQSYPIAIEKMVVAADGRSSPTIAGQTPRFVHGAGLPALDPAPYPCQCNAPPLRNRQHGRGTLLSDPAREGRVPPGSPGECRWRCCPSSRGCRRGNGLGRRTWFVPGAPARRWCRPARKRRPCCAIGQPREALMAADSR